MVSLPEGLFSKGGGVGIPDAGTAFQDILLSGGNIDARHRTFAGPNLALRWVPRNGGGEGSRGSFRNACADRDSDSPRRALLR